MLQRRNQSKRLDNPSISADDSGFTDDSAFAERIKRYQSTLWIRWQSLAPRDQVALIILSLFLLLCIGGYGGYVIHQEAKESKEDYQQQVADYFWLRSQAGNIDVNTINASIDDGTTSPANHMNLLLTTSGTDNAQVATVGDTVQLSFINPSQALVSNALSKMNAQGWQFTQLSMQQESNTKQIEVQATLVR